MECKGCGKVVAGDVYRCMDCAQPYHRVCLFKHCGKDDINHEPYLDALKSAEPATQPTPQPSKMSSSEFWDIVDESHPESGQ